MTPAPILVAGPTASGKSALALALAEATGGAVVNADSQQVYDGWRILSARPAPEEEARAPHFLYGHVPMEAEYSAGAWLRDAARVLAALAAERRRAIVVGGTGLYFAALTEGLAPIPPVPPETRAEAGALLAREGVERLAARLARRDPETAARLDPANPMRVLRAWEVLEATGEGLAAWRRRTEPPVVPPGASVRRALAPPRDWLRARCDARLDAMLRAGVLEEVRAVMARGLTPSAPGLRALGAPEFMAHLRGETGLDEALAAAKAATRRYAKRQLTWVRNRMADWPRIEEPITHASIPRLVADILA
jgi:tRNA dimethylallyltransferase